MSERVEQIPDSKYKRSPAELEKLLQDNPNIDMLDVEILSKLQIDGRASFNRLADELGVSVATVSKRVQKLRNISAIQGFSAVVSCDVLGFKENLWLMIYLTPGADVDAVGMKIRDLRGVRCLYSLYGEFDLLAHICCSTSEEIKKTLERIGGFPDVVRVTKMIVNKKIKEDFRVQI
ncbi:MAG: Lrp/AsnC family transcriptional regulator [Candidatus Thorarchaeota archaeon]